MSCGRNGVVVDSEGRVCAEAPVLIFAGEREAVEQFSLGWCEG